ncbi:MAG TPA: sulfite exporter TauE/SafE family protein [Caldimonas sp.]|nr:sulfite exporter TauE/SafE family protein [Caldimonas sp.]
MDSALVVSALLMGLAGGPHCAAMCGAACSVVAGPGGGERVHGPAASSLLALHSGRVVGYAAMGALAAASVAAIGTFSTAAPMVRPLWAMVHVAAVALGLWLAWFARAPAWLSAAKPRLAPLAETRPIRVYRTLPQPARAGLAGVAWVIIPCGLLQSALLVSALASTPASGAAVMAAFAIASTLGLWLAQRLWSGLRRSATGERLAAWPVRAAGVLLAGSSLFALWHGLGAALCGVA